LKEKDLEHKKQWKENQRRKKVRLSLNSRERNTLRPLPRDNATPRRQVNKKETVGKSRRYIGKEVGKLHLLEGN